MNRNIRLISCAAILFTWFWAVPVRSYGQANTSRPQEPVSSVVEIEKMRIEERARREAERKDWQTRVFDVRYADLNGLQRVLSMFPAETNISSSPSMISVRAPKEVMSSISDVIKKFDAPPKNVELTIFVLTATNQAGPAVPQILQPVVNELKTVLSYKQFNLVATEIVRGKDGSDVRTGGLLPQGGNIPEGTIYTFNSRFGVPASDQENPVLQLDLLRFSVQINAGPQVGYQNVGINTRVDIPRGQQVVVGKATLGDSALILVMSATFSD
jgi:hypothetical protein